MNDTTLQRFAEYRDLTGGDIAAAAALTLADAIYSSVDATAVAKAVPAGEDPDALLNLKQAAAYLGYSAEGLREIVHRTKRSRAGQHVLGTTIEFCQSGKSGSIRFRREWLDHFVEENRVGPGTPRLPAKQRRRPAAGRNQSPLVGGDRWDALCQ